MDFNDNYIEVMLRYLYADYKTRKAFVGDNHKDKYLKSLKRTIKYYSVKSTRKKLGIVF